MNEDLEHLRLLSIFHYVVAGLAALVSLMPVLHLLIGLGLIGGGLSGTMDDEVPGFLIAAVGCFFTLFPLLFILGGATYAFFMVRAGNSLSEQENHSLCLVMAAISCVFFPFGTVLGVLTLLVLMRPSVKELFGVTSASAGEAS